MWLEHKPCKQAKLFLQALVILALDGQIVNVQGQAAVTVQYPLILSEEDQFSSESLQSNPSSLHDTL
jgi:hypothetical protein